MIPACRICSAPRSTAICFVAKSWDYHVRVALGCTNEENLELHPPIRGGRNAAGREVLVDCEHFFDGYKANPDYALACAKAAYDSGARWVVLCDTNGGTMPAEISEIVRTVTKTVPGNHLGIHAHNDTEQAVANSLAAVDAGVRQIQGTLNGIGERCGNANLVSIIADARPEEVLPDRFETGVDDERLQNLTHVSRAFDELLNRAPMRRRPMSARAPLPPRPAFMPRRSSRSPKPTSMCRRRPSAIAAACWSPTRPENPISLPNCSRIGMMVVDKDDTRLDALLREVKEREQQGYAYDGADASFELLARRTLGTRAALLRCALLPRHRRGHSAMATRNDFRGRGEGEGRWRDLHQCGRGQWPGQRARRRAAQGSRQVSSAISTISNSSTTRCVSSMAEREPRPAF